MDPWRMRSAVVVNHAVVSSDQPLATSIGIDILKMGGNAADAAIATMLAVSVLQPWSTGVGGDCMCLFYRKLDKKVFAINGSGRSGENANLQQLLSTGITCTTDEKFSNHGCWVAVPGTVAGIFALKKHFGSKTLSMSEILQPVVKLAKEGVPLPYKAASIWNEFNYTIQSSKQVKDIFNTTDSVTPGEKVSSPKLANTLKEIADCGPEPFYCGKIAKKIVQEVRTKGGVLTLCDMKSHLDYFSKNEPSDGIYFDFHGFRVWEMKPNTIGIVALVALNALSLYDLKGMGHNSPEYIHVVVEAIKYSFLECWEYLCDPLYKQACFKALLSKNTGDKIKQFIDKKKVINCDKVAGGSCTSYVAAVDAEGNGCSFICSISSHFGAKIIPEDCGFVLHDRLKSMSLDEDSPNAYGPRKHCLHSIIPSLITDPATNDLLAVFGVYGRWMQPQGHVQVILNMIIFGMDPQTALNKPRFFVGDSKKLSDYPESLNVIHMEEGIADAVREALELKGHKVISAISGIANIMFGRGHIIASSKIWSRDSSRGHSSWFAGADPRSDGCAMGF